MNDKLVEALGYVDEKYIAAAARKKGKRKVFFAVAAAVLAVVILFNLPAVPFVVTARAVSIASESRVPERPVYNFFSNDPEYDAAYKAYRTAYDKNEYWASNASADMGEFFQAASAEFLSGSGENLIWSPVNAAIALSILAETADGTTRQEILDLLGIKDVQTLRSSITGLWEMCYQNDGNEISVLANSLWLDNQMNYDQSVMDTLAYDYFASVYQGDLGSGTTNRAIQTWVDNQTGGFLNKQSNGIDVSPTKPSVDTVLAMVSTVYIRSKWADDFNGSNNTTGTFTTPDGTVTATFMNKKEMEANYYWGESYGAVRLPMENDTEMWLLLPDEDKTTDDVLSSGEYLQMFQNVWENENSKYMKINLSVPQFDISSNLDLKEGLQALGVREVFDENGGDFGTTFETDLPVFVNRVNQASRVSIDEQGVTAASYIVMDWGVGAAMPPEEIIDFILDRPFVFAITGTGGIPIFMGVVNEP